MDEHDWMREAGRLGVALHAARADAEQGWALASRLASALQSHMPTYFAGCGWSNGRTTLDEFYAAAAAREARDA